MTQSNRRNWLAVLLGLFSLKPAKAQGTLTTITGLNRDRVDYTAVTSADTFAAKFAARSGVLDVYRNGMLQRQGQDYTVSTIGGVLAASFVTSANLQPGDLITLFYWR